MSINEKNISTDVVNNTLSAIEIVASRLIDKSGFDRTIEATIVKCLDETTGEYRVRYQDTLFSAFTSNTDVVYANKASVYISVPKNDFRNKKFILGTVKDLGTHYIPTISEKDSFEINGGNCVGNFDYKISLSSYYDRNDKGIEKILYQFKDENGNEINDIGLKQNELLLTLYDSDAMMVTMNVQNNIPAEQRYQGDYGLVFNLAFKNTVDSDNEYVIRSYVFSNNHMLGNPYKYVSKTSQTKAFAIDGINFDHVESIIAFSMDFPNPKDNKIGVDNIFLSNLEITGGKKLTTEDLNGYKLTILPIKGTYFIDADSAATKLPLQAQVRVKGKVAASDSSQIKYYWFRENARVDAASKYFLTIGGAGWECLNKYNVIDETKVEYIPGSYEYIAEIEKFPASETALKCCAVYNDETVISNTIIIKNLVNKIETKITSSNGTQFYYDSGNTVLTCSLIRKDEDDSDNPNYNYYWGKTDNTNYFSTIDNQTRELSVAAKDITEFTTYTCTVYEDSQNEEDKEIFLGSAQIVINNTMSAPAETTVLINGGTKVFKYNTNGVSPCAASQPNPEILTPLTFTIYDEERKEITAECDKVTWILPKENSMLEFPWLQDAIDNNQVTITDDSYIYTGKSVAYQIADRYKIYDVNNTIQLNVECRDLKLITQTQFTFTKEGEIGTNGTNFYCKIELNEESGIELPFYPTILNGKFLGNEGGKWFKAKLWEGNVDITKNHSDEIKTEWKVLANSYGTTSDQSHIIYDKNTDKFSVNTNFSWDVFTEGAADIVQVKVTYNKKDYYATIPVFYIETETDDIEINLKPRTGFTSVMYQTDGTNPAYANGYPFEIETNIKNPSFEWGAAAGQIYKNIGNNTKKWVPQNLLTIKLSDDSAINKRNVAPASIYDGHCLTNGIWCKVKNSSGNVVATIWIPIHMYLNRYGQELLNGWNGNSIEIKEDKGVIYSPQVGAGKKESDNSFTGVLLGKVQEQDDDNTELVGLFGYNSGVRSIFLDAYTGRAEFGAAGGGQIILDPRDKTAKIYSSDYSTTDKTGMLIDFTTPEIKFGSGYFNVDAEGKLTAKRGEIAGWEIGDNALTKGQVGISSDNSVNTNIAFWAGSSNASSAKFKVDYTGKVSASDIHSTGGTIGGWYISGSNIQNKETNPTVILNPSQFTLGDFTVNSNGDMYANGAKLDNVTANKGTMTDVNATGGTFTNITAVNITATSGKFTGDITANNIFANNGTIAGWSIGKDTISKGSTSLSSSSSNGKITTSNIEINEGKIYISGTSGWMALGWGTDHLATTGLNVTSTNGISFRSGMTYNSIGAAQGSIGMSGSTLLIKPAGSNKVVIGQEASGSSRIEFEPGTSGSITLRSPGKIYLRPVNNGNLQIYGSYNNNLDYHTAGSGMFEYDPGLGTGTRYLCFVNGIFIDSIAKS